ncbi:MAG: DUF3604 domain-containing protein [Acidobacteria bacterium]|nr:DUF3604 domain-containing protein [Acidobacteriota bacterium]
MRSFRVTLGLLGASAAALGAQAPDTYSPAAATDHATQVFWGDTHVHTSYSSGDANMVGTNDADPSIAYRFARGEVVEGRNGMPVRLRRPLDFLVIADHAESLGVSFSVQSGDPALLAEEIGRQLREAWLEVRERLGSYDERRAFNSQVSATGRAVGAPYRQTVWQRVAALADQYNEPGRFTAFAGYEWTSIGSDRQTFGNLHRVVVFGDDSSKTGSIVPFSAYDSRNPEDLWRFLARYEQTTGGQVLAIPHNGNVSNGEMFGLTNFEDEPLTAAYARTRQRWEPLYEVTQIKGDSETHPVLSPTDEFADFETWSSWAGRTTEPGEHSCCRQTWGPESMGALKEGEYARSGLKRGLKLRADLGVNPFKFGLIGSTDAHTSLATADSDNFWGKYSSTFPSPTRMLEPMVGVWPSPLNWETSASGYAAVWAERNTRAAIFAAMKRREVYATTGPRIVVRFFGGWDFEDGDADRSDAASIGYSRGVPMGGDLPPAPATVFLVGALRDPDGANLDRIQIVKGWLDAEGELHEQVHEVALSDGREVGPDGKAPAVGSTVDVEDASWENTIGAVELTAIPDFDSAEAAFYYARVIEVPTPRWTAYDAKYFGIEDPLEEIPMITRQRAYTSPIWYTPE